jgi:predicted Zn-dependent protease
VPQAIRRYATHWTQACIIVLIVALAASGCTTGVNPVSGNRRAYGYSWEEELRLGQQADQQIVQQYGLYDDDGIQGYVDRVGRDILEESHMRRADTPEQFRNTEFTFRVLDSPVVNAFALPGGYVYVTRGLMAHVNNEAQLAVVLGHEIAHVAARHASQQAAKQQFTQLGLIAGAIGGELAGVPGGSILQLGGQAAQLLSLKYSRDNERESDRLGVEYAALNGYATNEASDFFESLERIQEQGGQSLPTWQSSHPDPGAREQTMLDLAEQWRAELQQPLDRVGQDTYYATLEGVVLGDNPRQGFTRDGQFYHPDLRFQFPVPSTFQVVNQPSVVAMVAPNQDAIIQFSIKSDAESPRAAATDITGNESVRVVDQSDTRVSGLEAYRVEALISTQQDATARALVYYIAYNNRIYEFISYALNDNFGAYRDVFNRTMLGFAPLNDSSILNVQPTRMAIRPADRSAMFESFVPANLPEGFTITELAILNQLAVDEQVAAGQPLKLLNE